MHILIVEDDPLLCESLKRVLASAGHTFCEAATVKEAELRLQTEAGLDLVLLDIGLDGQWGGLRVAGMVSRRIPIFAVTGLDPTDVRIATATNVLDGISFWFEKPVDEAKLLRMIARMKNAP